MGSLFPNIEQMVGVGDRTVGHTNADESFINTSMDACPSNQSIDTQSCTIHEHNQIPYNYP